MRTEGAQPPVSMSRICDRRTKRSASLRLAYLDMTWRWWHAQRMARLWSHPATSFVCLLSLSCSDRKGGDEGVASNTASSSDGDGENGNSEGSSTTSEALGVEDCEGLLVEADCNNAMLADVGQCMWVPRYAPAPGVTSCGAQDATEACVGIIGSQQGCGLYSCPGDEGVNIYYRQADGGIELFVSPLCGPEPVGGWMACQANIPECSCPCSAN